MRGKVGSRKWSVVLVWSALLIALLALVAYRLSHGAVGAVFDSRPAGMGLGVLAFCFGLAGLWRARTRGPQAVGFFAAVLAVVATGLLGYDLLWVYHSEDIQFSSDVPLSGTLYLPGSQGEYPFPAAVITHGAGVENRRESAFYARMFARHGIAGLAYDKRGSGRSGGDLETATYEDLAADALAAVRYL